ncbi:Hypothetical protein D9617_10g074950 [Elsinoe fawcettii]|nr:Hypothetical protein D9617_10g074950 [Elsinoe fawcettii]
MRRIVCGTTPRDCATKAAARIMFVHAHCHSVTSNTLGQLRKKHLVAKSSKSSITEVSRQLDGLQGRCRETKKQRIKLGSRAKTARNNRKDAETRVRKDFAASSTSKFGERKRKQLQDALRSAQASESDFNAQLARQRSILKRQEKDLLNLQRRIEATYATTRR